jgi:hypothetical protein
LSASTRAGPFTPSLPIFGVARGLDHLRRSRPCAPRSSTCLDSKAPAMPFLCAQSRACVNSGSASSSLNSTPSGAFQSFGSASLYSSGFCGRESFLDSSAALKAAFVLASNSAFSASGLKVFFSASQTVSGAQSGRVCLGLGLGPPAVGARRRGAGLAAAPPATAMGAAAGGEDGSLRDRFVRHLCLDPWGHDGHQVAGERRRPSCRCNAPLSGVSAALFPAPGAGSGGGSNRRR